MTWAYAQRCVFPKWSSQNSSWGHLHATQTGFTYTTQVWRSMGNSWQTNFSAVFCLSRRVPMFLLCTGCANASNIMRYDLAPNQDHNWWWIYGLVSFCQPAPTNLQNSSSPLVIFSHPGIAKNGSLYPQRGVERQQPDWQNNENSNLNRILILQGPLSVYINVYMVFCVACCFCSIEDMALCFMVSYKDSLCQNSTGHHVASWWIVNDAGRRLPAAPRKLPTMVCTKCLSQKESNSIRYCLKNLLPQPIGFLFRLGLGELHKHALGAPGLLPHGQNNPASSRTLFCWRIGGNTSWLKLWLPLSFNLLSGKINAKEKDKRTASLY